MKYFIICIILVSSCIKPEETINDVKGSHIEFEKDYGTYKRTDLVDYFKFTYEGHDYIWFKERRGKLSTGGIVHNPDCKCFK